jgi:DNA primase small subunit
MLCEKAMLPQTLKFVQEKFLEYYKSSFEESWLPNSFENREFGALLFKEKTMVRHRSFKQFDELKGFLCELIPSDVYYSSAHYEDPAAKEMSEKRWLGADLVFDIDADHISTPCGKMHDSWVCGSCGFSGKGITPEKCPSCEAQKFDTKTWVCEVCLETTKNETIKLLDMLTNDFGLSAKEMKIYFSGHRGYHIHVENEAVRNLDQTARKEVVDYVVGIGLDAGFHGLKENAKIPIGPNLSDAGWGGRIAKGTYEVLLNAPEQELENLGLPKKAIEALVRQKNEILEGWKRRGPWYFVKNVGKSSWGKIIQRSIELQSAKIDTVVTTDIHRLIRLANTLHGKTGLMKTEVPTGTLEDFDPLKEAVAFEKGVAKVFVHESPVFRIGDKAYEAMREQEVELPLAAAMFLMCKGAAEVSAQHV